MTNLFIPNSTQFPNIVIDFIMPHLPDSEYKVLSYIYRRTFGFQRVGDRISLSQFTKGLVTKDGKRLDYGTGLSRTSNIKAIKTLKRLSLVIVVKSQGINYYQPVLDPDIKFIIKELSTLKKTTTAKIKERFKQLKLLIW